MSDPIDNNNLKNFGPGRVKKLKRTWDFICVSNDGRVVHFSKISRKVKAGVFFFFLALIFASAVSYLYVKERKELTLLTAKFIDLETNLQDVSRERDEMAAKMALAEKNSKDSSEKPLAAEKNLKNQQNQEPVQVKSEEEKSPKNNESATQALLDIVNFSAKRSKGSSVNLRFNLKAKNDAQKLNKGYIISALMPSSDSAPSSWKISEGDLKNGIPDNPEKGQFYSFKGEKEITIRLKAADASKAVKIFVFDENKKVAIDGVFQIADAPKTEKKKSRRK